jgi:hypothetical protein
MPPALPGEQSPGAGKSNDLRLDGAFADYDRRSGELGGSHSKPLGDIANIYQIKNSVKIYLISAILC